MLSPPLNLFNKTDANITSKVSVTPCDTVGDTVRDIPRDIVRDTVLEFCQELKKAEKTIKHFGYDKQPSPYIAFLIKVLLTFMVDGFMLNTTSDILEVSPLTPRFVTGTADGLFSCTLLSLQK